MTRTHDILFLKHVIGKDESAMAICLDDTNGKAPHVLEGFQNAWKEAQRNVTDWPSFFALTGCSDGFNEKIRKNVDGWIVNCVNTARARGKAYI